MQLVRFMRLSASWIGMLGMALCLAMNVAAKDKTLEKKMVFADLMAQEIEGRIVALQLAYEGANPQSVHFLNQAVSSFYHQRQYRPAWNNKTHLNELIFELESLVEDGLNPDDYQIEQLRHALALIEDESPESLKMRVDDELRATTSYLRAIYHLFNGKVDPAGLDPQWNFELDDLALTSIGVELVDIMDRGGIHDLFAKTRPQHPTYRNLVAGLKRYKQLAEAGGWPALPAGPTLKPCMIDPQVSVLRERLRVTGEYVDPVLSTEQSHAIVQKCLQAASSSAAASSVSAAPLIIVTEASSSVASIPALVMAASSASSSTVPVNPAEVFDEYLVEAVKKFQTDQYLEADGAIGPATRAALNVSVQSRIDQIRVNLDRARWLLHNIPPEMLLVDVAGFKITYFKQNLPIWRSRVQVGMAYRTSPIFKSEVNYITLNPTWTIPPTILRKDVLPKLRKDLGYLRDNKIRVLDSSGKELDPTKIDWFKPGNVTLRQDAGPHAALGKAVIRFPNSYSVYLHDTPHQKLFNKSQRAFSSGCIRVERALELVELLLAETPDWDKTAIDKALELGKTRNVTLAKRVPILLAYWTVDAISEEKIAFKPDIYARDAQVLAALNQRN
ncbi:MAG TPA: L,D-transpeptidase family protein [Cellvibrio sp.]|nr:L,D-transpeptidase family protein [Cellvibrio sp.]